MHHVHSDDQRDELTGTTSAKRLACPANEVSEVERIVRLFDYCDGLALVQKRRGIEVAAPALDPRPRAS